ncbi:MAG: phosphate signaling complex protein PhoU [Roseovarius sp.]|nr:phosphate signaling complex protein PhoU [Roseovarius sp.]MCY4207120.1 phosphate signaling complex protein PhoU [Roseovarius sp.]MCY4316030.1 phosphate signaling complex protein PhoU [Roseovarius sp.]
MNDEHISSAFDRDLEAIQAEILKMGGLVEEAIMKATVSLETHDSELADEVCNADASIDLLEEQINQEAARVIALRQPAAVDLRVILTVLKIAANLERIGDYAKNMAKRTRVLSQLTQINGATASLRRMAREVERMLRDALNAFIMRDSIMANGVLVRDQDVDQMYNALFREFLTFMMEDPRNITPCIQLHFIAKNIERMGDLVTNIAEQVVYLVTGTLPDDARPKMDLTSMELEVIPQSK